MGFAYISLHFLTWMFMQLINDMNFLMCDAFTSVCTWLPSSLICKAAASGRREVRRRKAAEGGLWGRGPDPEKLSRASQEVQQVPEEQVPAADSETLRPPERPCAGLGCFRAVRTSRLGASDPQNPRVQQVLPPSATGTPGNSISPGFSALPCRQSCARHRDAFFGRPRVADQEWGHQAALTWSDGTGAPRGRAVPGPTGAFLQHGTTSPSTCSNWAVVLEGTLGFQRSSYRSRVLEPPHFPPPQSVQRHCCSPASCSEQAQQAQSSTCTPREAADSSPAHLGQTASARCRSRKHP